MVESGAHHRLSTARFLSHIALKCSSAKGSTAPPYHASLTSFGQGVMPSCWNSLNFINCPVLLIVGEKDLKYRSIAERMHRQLSQAELAIVPDAGHCPHLEKAENTGTIIQKWFDRHGL